MKTEPTMTLTPCDGPLEIWRIGDDIVVIGPGAVAFSLSRDAGEETCRRIRRALALGGSVTAGRTN